MRFVAHVSCTLLPLALSLLTQFAFFQWQTTVDCCTDGNTIDLLMFVMIPCLLYIYAVTEKGANPMNLYIYIIKTLSLLPHSSSTVDEDKVIESTDHTFVPLT